MTKYYNKDIPDNVHVMYCCRQSGKTYYEFKKLKEENERLKAQLELEEDNRHFLNNKIDKAVKYLNLKVDLDKNHLEKAINDMEEDLLEILKKGEE